MMQLKAFPVVLPPIDKQDGYAQLIEHTEARRGGIEDLFSSLVARAFSGSLGA